MFAISVHMLEYLCVSLFCASGIHRDISRIRRAGICTHAEKMAKDNKQKTSIRGQWSFWHSGKFETPYSGIHYGADK